MCLICHSYIFDVLREEQAEDYYYCDVCSRDFVSEEDHYDQVLESYVLEVTRIYGPSKTVIEFLQNKLIALGLKDDLKPVEFNNFAVCTEKTIRSQIVSLNSFLKLENLKSSKEKNYEWTTICQGILTELQLLDGFKQPVYTTDFVLECLKDLIDSVFENDPFTIAIGYKFLLQDYPEKFTEMSEIHDFFTRRFMNSDTLEEQKTAIAGFHYSENVTEEEFKQTTTIILSNLLEEFVNESNFESLSGLLNLISLHNVSALEGFIDKKEKQYDLKQITGDYKAVILLVRGMISKVHLDFEKCVIFFQNAITACTESPFESRKQITHLISTLCCDLTFHTGIVDYLWADIEEMKNNIETNLSALSPSLKLDELCTLKLWFRQVKPTEYRIAQKNEEAIKSRLKTPLAKALGYFDLSTGLDSPSGTIISYLMGTVHLLKAMKSTPTKDFVSCYAYFKIVERFSLLAMMFGRRYSGPNMQIYIQRLILSVLRQSALVVRQKLLQVDPPIVAENTKTNEDILSPLGKAIVSEALSDIIQMVKVHPLICFPMQSVTDNILKYSQELSFLTDFIHIKAQKTNEHSKYFPKYLYSYQELDSVWRGWGNEENVENFQEARLKCLTDLVEYKGWNVEDVEDVMAWNLIRRTEQGWMNNEEKGLNFDDFSQDEIFANCRGMEINSKTGEITLLLDQDLEKPDNIVCKDPVQLFSLADVAEIFQKQLIFVVLTLEDPDPTLRSHPCQEFSYWPPELKDSDYLYTLLHADYFLKQITTGVEINAFSPFEIRPSRDGFLQRLPQDLQDQLRPILERCRDPINPSDENAHRFWIEFGTVETKLTEFDEFDRFEFGTVIVSVQTKKLKRTTTGELVDDNDNPDDLSSAEAQLAKFLTQNYDTIGSFFPFLLRLKELAKISRICHILSQNAKRFADTILAVETFNPNIPCPVLSARKLLEKMVIRIQATLDGFRETIGYDPLNPYCTEANIEKDYQETLKLNNLCGKEHQLAPGERDRVRNHIRTQLMKQDSDVLTGYAEGIAQFYQVQVQRVRPLMYNWFAKKEFEQNQLVQLCFESERAKAITKARKHLEELKAMGIKPLMDTIIEISLKNSGECCWVPAAFCNKFEPPIQLQCEEEDDPIATEKEEEKTTASSQTTDTGQKLGQSGVPVNSVQAISPQSSQALAVFTSLGNNSGGNSNNEMKLTPSLTTKDDHKSKPNEVKHEEANKNRAKRKVPSGIKPHRIYGGVSSQVAVNLVDVLSFVPQMRALRVSGKMLQGLRMVTGKRFTAGRSSGSGGNSGGSSGGNSGGSSGSGANKGSQPKTTYEAKSERFQKPVRHFVPHSSKKRAKDAGRKGGTGKPEHDHPQGKFTKGQPTHYHSQKDGKRVDDGVHHSYGKGNVRAGKRLEREANQLKAKLDIKEQQRKAAAEVPGSSKK